MEKKSEYRKMNDKEKMPTTRWRVLCDEIRLFPPAGKLVFLCYVNKANVRTRWNYLLNGKQVRTRL